MKQLEPPSGKAAAAAPPLALYSRLCKRPAPAHLTKLLKQHVHHATGRLARAEQRGRGLPAGHRRDKAGQRVTIVWKRSALPEA